MPGLRRSRAAGVLAALAAAVLTFALSAGPAWAVGSARADGPTIGPSAQAAYGVAVTFSLPPHLSATGLHVTLPQAVSSGLHVTPPHAAASDWTCDVRRVTCTGTLPSGASRTVAVTGRLPAAAPNLTTTRTPAPAD